MFFVDRLAKSGTLDAPSAAWVENYSIGKKKGRTEIHSEPVRFLAGDFIRRYSSRDILSRGVTQCRIKGFVFVQMV